MSTASPERKPRRATPKSVKRAETLSRLFISLGGMGTIVAVITIFAFLFSVVIPLFKSGKLEAETPQAVATPAESPIIESAVDEQQILAWQLRADGQFTTLRIQNDDSIVASRALFDGKAPTAWAFSPSNDVVAFGFADGSVRTGEIGFRSRFLEGDDVTPEMKDAKPGSVLSHPDGAVFVTPEPQYRLETVRVRLKDPTPFFDDEITLIDVGGNVDDGLLLAAMSTSGKLAVAKEEITENLMTGEETVELDTTALPFSDREREGGLPQHLLLSGTGNGTIAHRGRRARASLRRTPRRACVRCRAPRPRARRRQGHVRSLHDWQDHRPRGRRPGHASGLVPRQRQPRRAERSRRQAGSARHSNAKHERTG